MYKEEQWEKQSGILGGDRIGESSRLRPVREQQELEDKEEEVGTVRKIAGGRKGKKRRAGEGSGCVAEDKEKQERTVAERERAGKRRKKSRGRKCKMSI